MNFAFLSRQAEHPNEGLILGAIAVGVTGYNALGPLFIGWAWENSRTWFVVPAGALMWVVFVGFSLLCAVGFTASNRGAVTGSREAEAAWLESAQSQLKKTDGDLAALTRPARGTRDRGSAERDAAGRALAFDEGLHRGDGGSEPGLLPEVLRGPAGA
jgi:hypothetical protein